VSAGPSPAPCQTYPIQLDVVRTRSLTWLAKHPDPIFWLREILSARPFLPFSYYDFLGPLGPTRNNSIDISSVTDVDHLDCTFSASD
jgi:hypothetical protein